MECKNIQDLLSAYLEGIIAPEEKRLVEKHLASCKQCGEALEDLTKTKELVHTLEEVEPPPWFTQKIMAQVREEAEKKSGILERLFYPLRIKVPIQALATALIVVMALYVYRSVEPEMKLAQAPSETARVVTKDEVREQNGKAGASSPTTESKTVPSRAPGRETITGEKAEKDKIALRSETADLARGVEKLEPPKLAEQQVVEKKQEAPADRQTQEMKVAAAPPSRKEVPQLQKGATALPAPAAGPREAESVASAGAQVKETRERKASAPAGEMKAFAAKRAEPLAVTVRVSDVAAAAPQVQNLLAELGARNIRQEPREGTEVITANLKTEKVKGLYDKLSTMGEIKEKLARPEIPTEDVTVSIEIVGSR